MPSRSQLPAEIVFFVRTSTAEPLLLPPAHVLLPRSPKDMMRTLPPRLQQYLHVARVVEGHEGAGPAAHI